MANTNEAPDPNAELKNVMKCNYCGTSIHYGVCKAMMIALKEEE